MAILETIRRRSGLLITVIGVAMFAFIIGDFLNSGTNWFSTSNSVGSVNGKDIAFKDFSNELKILQSQNPSIGNGRAIENVWNEIERNTIMSEEFDALGIYVTDDDLMNALKEDSYIQSLSVFQDESGNFDESKLSQYINTVKGDPNQNIQNYMAWINYENVKRKTILNDTYSYLVSSGLYASYKEGELEYKFSNDKIKAEYVYVPYYNVNDSLVPVSTDEMIQYVKEASLEEDYKSKPSTNMQYVFVEVKPSDDDKKTVLSSIENLLGDIEFYDENDKVTKTKKGFRKTENDSLFVLEYSDEPYDDKYYHNLKNKDLDTWVKGAKEGDIYGPYEERGAFIVSKLEDIKTIPDSVNARHILISFKNPQSPDIERTREDAKKLADSLFNIVRLNKNSFSDIAKNFSNDNSNSKNSGNLGWFTYGVMVSSFNDFCFNGKKGNIAVVETVFGYHIIEILDQKNISKAYKLATLEKKIYVSEETDNMFYEKASKLSSKKYTNLDEFIKTSSEMNLESRTVQEVGIMDFSMGLEGEQRNVIKWSFNDKTNVGDVKMFDVNNGYLIAFLYSKNDKDGWNVEKLNQNIKPKIVTLKKAELLKKKLSGVSDQDLDQIAKKYSTHISSITSITFNENLVSGVGREPKVIGALFGSKENVVTDVVGDNGLFFIKVSEKNNADSLTNYFGLKSKLANSYQSKGNIYYIFTSLKKTCKIEDNRHLFF